MRKYLGWLFCVVLCLASFTARAGPSYAVYEESLGSGWISWSWTTVPPANSTVTSFKGSTSMRVVYTNAWQGFSPGAGETFCTAGYKHLTLAVYNDQNGDDLYLFAAVPGGKPAPSVRLARYAPFEIIPQGSWTWLRIPIQDLGLGSAPVLSYFAIQSGKANAIAYFDEIRFDASATFYEGVQGQMGPGMLLYSWSANVSQPIFSGDTQLDVNVTQPWGGVQLQQRTLGGSIVSSDYGALTVVFKKTQANQTVYATLINENNVVVGTVGLTNGYLPETLRPMVTNKWYRVAIPLSHFFSGTVNLGAVVFSGDVAGTFSVDDVRIIQKLGWPMKGYSRQVSNPIGGDFGDDWNDSYCGGLIKRHSGTDYDDFSLSGGTSIYAASRGFVKQVGTQTGWGNFVVIQHESGLTTNYLHLDSSNVSINQEVERGTPLGKTTNLSSGSHLHFGLRVADYNNVVSQTGGLPQTVCAIEGTTYPAFPAYFLNPEMMNWGILP